ncbi:efflux RND transporter periplasmic adaptor subunit [Cardiobacteriaceae bacterium TAE3-ERU3]|nr:efflux RND transporter periplasmic adaptor subunit [Cardiobacteriaceae bacterium TAE3-ERU3]
MIKKLFAAVLLMALVAIAVFGYMKATAPQPIVFQGQLEARTTDIGAKVPGRVANIYVQEGDHIDVGTLIMDMDVPEIDAKVEQAKAGYEAAEAVANKARKGARPQEIEMAKSQYERAKAGANFAEESWQRVSKLANEGLLSKQKRDETYAQYRNAIEQREAAKAQYDMARAGARPEDIEAAESQAQSVAAQVSQAEIARDESRLKSPIAGEVANVIPNPGQLMPQGVPVISVVDLNDQWLVLNIREDYIRHFALNSTFTGRIPALQNREVDFTVFTSSVLPDFAIWRPTRNNEGYDMRTFEVKARPDQPIEGMRPGMSVLVGLPEGA